MRIFDQSNVLLQGILMTQLAAGGAGVRQALMVFDAQRLELRLVGAVAGKVTDDSGSPFHTLRGALTAFEQRAAFAPIASHGGRLPLPITSAQVARFPYIFSPHAPMPRLQNVHHATGEK